MSLVGTTVDLNAISAPFQRLPISETGCILIVAALDPNPSERIDLPILLVTGEADRAGTVSEDAHYWARRDLAARWMTISNAGHVPQLEKLEEFNRIVAPFLQEVAVGRWPGL